MTKTEVTLKEKFSDLPEQVRYQVTGSLIENYNIIEAAPPHIYVGYGMAFGWMQNVTIDDIFDVGQGCYTPCYAQVEAKSDNDDRLEYIDPYCPVAIILEEILGSSPIPATEKYLEFERGFVHAANSAAELIKDSVNVDFSD